MFRNLAYMNHTQIYCLMNYESKCQAYSKPVLHAKLLKIIASHIHRYSNSVRLGLGTGHRSKKPPEFLLKP